jgi:TonB family protein
MNDIGFLRTSPAHLPPQRQLYAVAWVFYAIVLVAMVALVRPHPVRMNPGGTTQIGIAAFNPGPVGTAGPTQPKPKAPTQAVKKPAPSEITRATAVSRDEMSSANQGSGAAGAQGIGSGSGSGPVNLGTGAGLTLLRKVTPTYPRLMEQARVAGIVVLDAIIHGDGTIGDITLKSSTNDAFAQAAIAAVKQWRYSPIPYEGIVTVTVNFNLPR